MSFFWLFKFYFFQKKIVLVKLIPRDDPKISARTEYFNKLISKVPIGAISLGSFMHPEFCGTTKSPFLGPAKQTFLSKSNTYSKFKSISRNFFFG